MKRRYISIILTFFVVFFISLSNIFAYSPIRASSEPYISGDSFRSLANHLFDETDSSFNPKTVQNGDIIFVKTDLLGEFFSQKHPSIINHYILISHNADHGAPGNYVHYLEDEKIIVWFGQNPTISNHKKFIAIPIGIANRCWQHGNIDNFNKALTFLHQHSIYIFKDGIFLEKYLAGINFKPASHTPIRETLLNYFSNQSFCKNIEHDNHLYYLSNMFYVKFLLSPRGNGLDCHRTWEALLMGSIPILEHSYLDQIFIDMPVLLINKWEDVTQEFLENKYKEMGTKSYNFNKTYFPYWKELITSYQLPYSLST